MFGNLSTRTNYDMAILVDDMRSRRIAYNFENLKQVQTELINRRMESRYIGDIADMMRSMLESGVMESPSRSEGSDGTIGTYHHDMKKTDSNVKSAFENHSAGHLSDDSDEISAIKRRMARKAEIIRQLKELDSEEDDEYSDNDGIYSKKFQLGSGLLSNSSGNGESKSKLYKNEHVSHSDEDVLRTKERSHDNFKSEFFVENSGKKYKGKDCDSSYGDQTFENYQDPVRKKRSYDESSFFKSFKNLKELKSDIFEMDGSVKRKFSGNGQGSFGRNNNISIPEARKQELGFEYFDAQGDMNDVELNYPVFQFLQVFYKIFAWFFAIATMVLYTFFAITTKISPLMLVGLFGASVIVSVSFILMFYTLSENILWKLEVLKILSRKK